MKNEFTRRDILVKGGLGGLALVVARYIPGCNSGVGTSGGREGTGVRGLNDPDEILSNPYIDDLIRTVNDYGYSPRLNRDVNPPVISGRYSIAGEQIYPDSGPLAPGTFRWSNQTADNHINTDYEQITQIGSNVLGEIIRGEGDRFSVYSILNISESGCTERAVFIVDGVQNNSGDVEALYMGTPADTPRCFTPSAGTVYLGLIGPEKIIVKAEEVDALKLFKRRE